MECVDDIEDGPDIALLDRMMSGLSGKETLAELRDRGLDCRYAMVTAMLDHLDRGSMYKLLRTLNDRVDRIGYLGVCTIDTAEYNEQTVSMLADAFDAMVELRETIEGPEFRTTGLPAGRNWTPLST